MSQKNVFKFNRMQGEDILEPGTYICMPVDLRTGVDNKVYLCKVYWKDISGQKFLVYEPNAGDVKILKTSGHDFYGPVTPDLI